MGASIRINEIDLFNKQLDNLHCQILKDLCKLLVAGKLRRITDEEQIDIMKVQTQATGLSTAQIGDKLDFWKQVDDEDFHKWLLGRYNSHTGNCYHSPYYYAYWEDKLSPVDIIYSLLLSISLAIITVTIPVILSILLIRSERSSFNFSSVSKLTLAIIS